MTVIVSQKSKTGVDGLTVERICPSAEHNTLRVWLMLLKVQQMADQHLNLRSVASEAFYFADGAEEVSVDVVVLNDPSGLGGFFILLSIRVRGTVFDTELLELVFVNGNAELPLRKMGHAEVLTTVPANRTNFPVLPRNPSF